MAKPSAPRRFLFGFVTLASIPAVGWLSFNYHFLVGLAVTLIYGSGALLIGGTSIVSAIALGAQQRLPAGDPEPIPKARVLRD